MSNPQRTADLLFQHWQQDTVCDALPDDVRPDTIDQAYCAQAALLSHFDSAVAGWKIAATAEAGRQHINVDRPLAGRLFSAIVAGDNAEIPFSNNRMGVAEAEFALMLGADLPPRPQAYTEREVLLAIRSVHPGLEFPDSRFRDFTQAGAVGLIADNACASQFVLGPASATPFDAAGLAAQASALRVNHKTVTHGTGRDALGGPVQALTWLANTLSELGIGLSSGQFVTTGVTGKPSPVRTGDHVCADLGSYGRVSATLI